MLDQADQDYTDPNNQSVLYAAYKACKNSTLIPYGKGAVTGSANSFATADANGATVTVTYTSASGQTESTASERNIGDTVTVSVQYDMTHRIFVPYSFPVISSMVKNGHAYVTRQSNIVITQ